MAASIMNDMVLGVHDVANGSADAALQAMKSEMEVIRTVPLQKSLEIPQVDLLWERSHHQHQMEWLLKES